MALRICAQVEIESATSGVGSEPTYYTSTYETVAKTVTATTGGPGGGQTAGPQGASNSQGGSGSGGLSTAATAGIAAGVTAGGLLVAFMCIIIFWRRRRVIRQRANPPPVQTPRGGGGAGGGGLGGNITTIQHNGMPELVGQGAAPVKPVMAVQDPTKLPYYTVQFQQEQQQQQQQQWPSLPPVANVVNSASGILTPVVAAHELSSGTPGPPQPVEMGGNVFLPPELASQPWQIQPPPAELGVSPAMTVNNTMHQGQTQR